MIVKAKKRKLLIGICALVLAVTMIVGVVYAADIFIRQKNSYTSKTDILTVNNSNPTNGNYYVNLSSGSSVTVYRHHDTKTQATVTHFDLIVFSVPNATSTGTRTPDETLNVVNKGVKEKCWIFKNIQVTGAGAPASTMTYVTISGASYRVVAVPSKLTYKSQSYDIPNLYINSQLKLKLANNQTYYNENMTITGRSQAYVNIFLISDVDITDEISFSAPCYVNVLYSNFTLKKDFYIKHSYPGVFAFETINGKITSEVELDEDDLPVSPIAYKYKIYIDTPSAYYRTGLAAEEILISKAPTNLTTQQMEALCEDAINFALGRIADYVYDTFSLPVKYQNYDVTFTYRTDKPLVVAVPNATASAGIVKRSTGNEKVEVSVSVTVKSGVNSVSSADMIASGKLDAETVRKTITVVGTSNPAMSTAFAEMFDLQLRKAFGVFDVTGDDGTLSYIYSFQQGIDVASLVYDFLLGSGATSLTMNSLSGGEFVYWQDAGNDALGNPLFNQAEGSAAALNHTPNSVTQQPGTVKLTSFTQLSAGGGFTLEPQGDTIDGGSKIYMYYNERQPTLSLQFKVNGAESLLNYDIVRSKEDIISIIERYMTTPYIASLNDWSDIYYLDGSQEGMLTNDSVPLLTEFSVFTIGEITNGVIALSRAEYEELISGTKTIQSLLSRTEENGIFGFPDPDDPEMNPDGRHALKAVRPIAGLDSVYIMWQKFDFKSGIYLDDNGDPDEEPYIAYRRIETPTTGIAGGNQYEAFMRGDYFANNFKDGKVISEESVGVLEITDMPGVSMNVQFTDIVGNRMVYDFLKLVLKYDSGGQTGSFMFDYSSDIDDIGIIGDESIMSGYSLYHVYRGGSFDQASSYNTYNFTNLPTGSGSVSDDTFRLLNQLYFYVDLTKVPVTNTAIIFEVEFFYYKVVGEGDEKEVSRVSINKERYQFIVPGIYRSGIDFDKPIYDYMVNCIENAGSYNGWFTLNSDIVLQNVDQYVYKGYLLVDGARLFVTLNAAAGNLTAAGIPIPATITGKGILYLTSLRELSLSGLALESLEEIAKATNLTLNTLDLSNCGIRDASLGTRLVVLRNLKHVNLAENYITDLSGILYRTVTYLDVSNQKRSLIDIRGLQTLYNLEVVKLSGNNILTFEPLRSLAALQEAYVDGNSVSPLNPLSMNINFGTRGKTNIAVYVHLMVKKVKVYADGVNPLILSKDTMAEDSSAGYKLSYVTLAQYTDALLLNAIIYKGVQEAVTIGGIDFPAQVTDRDGTSSGLSTERYENITGYMDEKVVVLVAYITSGTASVARLIIISTPNLT